MKNFTIQRIIIASVVMVVIQFIGHILGVIPEIAFAAYCIIVFSDIR